MVTDLRWTSMVRECRYLVSSASVMHSYIHIYIHRKKMVNDRLMQSIVHAIGRCECSRSHRNRWHIQSHRPAISTDILYYMHRSGHLSSGLLMTTTYRLHGYNYRNYIPLSLKSRHKYVIIYDLSFLIIINKLFIEWRIY